MEMKLDYILVDEVSMLHSNFYKSLMIIKKLKNCKLIISGDFNQLDVIYDLQKSFYFLLFPIICLYILCTFRVWKSERFAENKAV